MKDCQLQVTAAVASEECTKCRRSPNIQQILCGYKTFVLAYTLHCVNILYANPFCRHYVPSCSRLCLRPLNCSPHTISVIFLEICQKPCIVNYFFVILHSIFKQLGIQPFIDKVLASLKERPGHHIPTLFNAIFLLLLLIIKPNKQ